MNIFSIKIELFKFILFSLSIESSSKKDETTTKKETIKNKDLETESHQTSMQINNQYAGSVKPDLKEFERQLNPVKDIPAIIVTCETCNGTTYDDDINVCNKCGKSTCSICGNYDPRSRYNYCQECWEKL